MLTLQESATGATLAVKVQPRARRNTVVGELGGALKIALTAPPIDGRANQACIDFLAELLNLPRASITIVSGMTSRNKVMHIEGLTAEQLRARLQP